MEEIKKMKPAHTSSVRTAAATNSTIAASYAPLSAEGAGNWD
jgi:hypothetical protein